MHAVLGKLLQNTCQHFSSGHTLMPDLHCQAFTSLQRCITAASSLHHLAELVIVRGVSHSNIACDAVINVSAFTQAPVAKHDTGMMLA